MRFAGDALTGGYIDAGNNSGADIYADMAKKAPDYGKLGNISMAERSKEKQSSIYAQGKVAGAGLESLGKVTEAQNMAEAGIAAAEAEASATRQNGMMDMFGSIGGGALGAFKSSGAGGPWKDASDIGFKGNQVNDLGRIRY